MKNILRSLAFILTFLSILSLPIFAQNVADGIIEGNWLGAIESNGVKIRLGLRVSKSANGSLTAKLDSIDQGANDLAIDTITQNASAIYFEAKKIGFSYEGRLNEKGNEITGQLKQGANFIPIVFKRIAVVPKLGRPQNPQKPYSYDEEEVIYRNEKDNVKLAGTLTFPRTAGQHPAVILITGSGSQDRNETIVGHRPFLVLADYLTRRGIAVLRVDDRGMGGSDSGAPGVTRESYAGDVITGIDYLKTRKEINPRQIGPIGHSEGGMIAPKVAVRRPNDVAFIVSLAGLGQTGEDVISRKLNCCKKREATRSK